MLALRFPRSLATLTAYSSFLVFAYATGCGDSSSGDDGDGASGGSSGASGASGASGSSGSSGTAGESGSSGSSGKGGTSGQGGSSGKGGTTSTGGAPGGQGGEGNSGGMPGGAGGEGGDGGLTGTTCKSILESAPSATTGVYRIDPEGNPGAPFDVVCDMTTSGGGWTLGFVKNSLDNGNYQDFGSSYVNVAALATSPADASGMTYTTAVAGWANLNDFPYTELRLAGYRNGAEAYSSVAIAKSSLRLQFGQNGYFLYNDANGYYWCGGEAAYTDGGTGQESQPTGAPADCKGHTSLGNGYDFSTSNTANAGLTICGGGSVLMTTGPASGFIGYGSPGASQAIWVR